MIRLEKVNEKTFRKIIKMKLPPEQERFVAPNVVSLAQAWLDYEAAHPLAVLNDDEPVGFLMLDWDEGERTVGFWRFMIAPEYQHRGFGRQALQAAIEMVRVTGKFDMIYLDYVPGNTIARELYYALGFRENGEVEDGEIVMTLPLTDQPKLGMLTADDADLDSVKELIAAAQPDHVPDVFSNANALASAIADGRVTRFTIMGKTVALAVGKETLLFSQEYRNEVEQKLMQL